MSDLLSQDEIDALLHGVDDGDIDLEEEEILANRSFILAKEGCFTLQDLGRKVQLFLY